MTAEPRSLRISPAIGIPLITLIFYVLSFGFEVGYAFRFGIPVDLIQLSVDIVVNAATGVFIFSFILVAYLQINLQYWPNTQKHLLYLIIGVVVAFVGYWILRVFIPQYIGLIFLVSSVFAYFGGLALQRHDEASGNSTPKIAMAYDARSEIHKESIAYGLVSKFGFDPLLAFAFVFLIGPSLFFFAGYSEGVAKETFLKFESKGNRYVVLRVYGTTAVSARLSLIDCKITKVFTVHNLNDLGDLALEKAEDSCRELPSPPNKTLHPTLDPAAAADGGTALT